VHRTAEDHPLTNVAAFDSVEVARMDLPHLNPGLEGCPQGLQGGGPRPASAGNVDVQA